MGYGAEFTGTMLAEIPPFWKVLTQQAVGVLVAPALPGALRVAEIDIEPSVDAQSSMLSHLRALVPSQ